MTNVRKVEQCLREVIDPELGIDVVAMGMIHNIRLEEQGERVVVQMTLTSMSCPFWQLFVDQVESALQNIRGIRSVDVEFVADPPWSPDLIEPSARAELESVGLLPPKKSDTPFRAGGLEVLTERAIHSRASGDSG